MKQLIKSHKRPKITTPPHVTNIIVILSTVKLTIVDLFESKELKQILFILRKFLFANVEINNSINQLYLISTLLHSFLPVQPH